MKKPFEMTFAEFADAVKPSGSVNRMPEMNRGLPVYSYSVFMNGDVAADLAAGSRQFDFKDVMVTALTRQLGLDSKSFRDNLKVSELAAARSAWMECVSAEHHRNRAWGLEDLSGDVLKDYEQLSKGMVHPFIQRELDNQRKLTKGLQPMLAAASQVVGKKVEDVSPDEVSVGKVVSQSTDFIVQETTTGEIVTHEKRRLDAIPKDGAKVTVSYYRGSGQVVDSLENMKVSTPFIEKKSCDLAITLTDGRGKEQVVLFNSLTNFDKFVKAHGLNAELVRVAVDVRSATPKVVAPVPVRVLVSDVYIDAESGCLAVDYKENGVEYSALFGSAKDLEAQAKAYGLGSAEIDQGRVLESGQRKITNLDVDESLKDLVTKLAALGVEDILEPAIDGQQYIGVVVSESALHVAQDTGRGMVMIHDKRELDKAPHKGDLMTVKYEKGRGRVEDMVRESKDLGR